LCDADENSYCCLGVACELYAQEHSMRIINRFSDVREGNIKEYDGASNYLPSSVQNWLGLTVNNGCYYSSAGGGCETCWLSSKNDDVGMTFTQIADLIESEPEGLFMEKKR
jgi:hypothetical protein